MRRDAVGCLIYVCLLALVLVLSLNAYVIILLVSRSLLSLEVHVLFSLGLQPLLAVVLNLLGSRSWLPLWNCSGNCRNGVAKRGQQVLWKSQLHPLAEQLKLPALVRWNLPVL